ncbi:hypothetical protein [Paenibacillus sp. HGF5]|uniref:hypothetical protein n=1 Tax=Paenibacillus sp. HGF5 TaxID=908341 RepID=UPI0002072D65|nr:hypothetical protein [Paenibacillus sp. HGF5]EGG35213.1 hypothetical protein HMPREF9412_3211 [Paenibacillus sp. HGF5]
MTNVVMLEVSHESNVPSLVTSLYPVGYRYSRRIDRFILVWKPENKRKQEIDVPIRVLALTLPETFASICAGYTAGCVEVTVSELRDLGFYVEVTHNAGNA